MPGLARIQLICVPAVGYNRPKHEKLQIGMETHVTSTTDRDLATLVVTDEPDWVDLVGRLDLFLSRVAVGLNPAGMVKPNPNEPFDPVKWNWNAIEHEYIRSLYFDNAPWKILAEAGAYNGDVKAKYSYRYGTLLP